MFLGMLRAWLALVRPAPVLVFCLLAAGAAIAGRLTFDLLLQALFVLPTVAGITALNDFFDLPSDAALGRNDRPLVSGRIKRNQVLALSILYLATGLVLCFYFASFLMVITTCLVLLGIAYNVVLKRMPVIGNIVVALCYAVPLLYGNALADQSLSNLRPVILLLACLNFFRGFGRELMGTVRDIEGDRKLNAVSLPMLVGVRPVVTFYTILSIVLVALSPLPLLFFSSIPYAVLVGAAGAFQLACDYAAFKDSSYSNLQRLTGPTTFGLFLMILAMATLPYTTQPP